jgi:methionine-rich copper-binding protein CopC
MKNVTLFMLPLLCRAAFASAHATAEKSEPRVGSEISKPPAQVKIWFSEEVEPAFSRIQVFAPDGKEVDKHDTRTDPKDKRLLIVSLPEILPPGTYRVHWQVVSVDTHRTHDEFKFVLKR